MGSTIENIRINYDVNSNDLERSIGVLRNAGNAVSNIRSRINSAGQASISFSTRAGTMNQTVQILRNSGVVNIRELANSTNQAENSFVSLDTRIRQVAGTISTSFKNAGAKISGIGSGIKNVGSSLTNNISKPLAGVAMSAIDTTMTFDSQMSKVRSLAGGTSKDFSDMREKALEMGKSTSKTATESAQAFEYMALAGWETSDMMKGIEPVLRLSEAGAMDLGRTSDLVTDSMSALGLEVEDLEGYLNIATEASRNSNTSIGQFLEAMVKGGGQFRMFNVPLEEAGGLLGILANRGFKASQAGNAITSLMANLTTGSGQAGKAMGELNIEVYDSQGKFRGITTILKELNTKFSTMTEAQKNTYIQMIGGKTRTKELNALLNGTSEELDKLTGKLKNSDGALMNMATTMQDNLKGQFTRLKSAIEGLLIDIGDRLTPIIKMFAFVAQKVADVFSGLPSPIKTVVVIIGGLVASIGPLILILGGLVVGIGAVVSGIGAIAGVISTVGLPIIATIIAGIIGLTAQFAIFATISIASIVSFIDALIPLRDTFNLLKNFINGDLKGAFRSLTNDFGMSKDKANGLLNRLIELKIKASQLWTVLKDNLGTVFKIILGSLSELIGGFNLFNNSTDETKSNVTGMIQGILKPLEQLINYLYKTLDSFGLIPAKVKYAKDKTVLQFIELNSQVKKNLSEILSFNDTFGLMLVSNNKKAYEQLVKNTKESLDKELKFATDQLEKKKNLQIKSATELFKNSQVLTEKAETERLKKISEFYNKEKEQLKTKNEQIKTIINTAQKERRILTSEELATIEKLRKESETKIVTQLSTSKLKQKAILEESKTLAVQISRDEALQVITEANKQYDKVVENAKKTKTDKIAQIIELRDQSKIISNQEAENMIKEANRQYKSVTGKAKDTKDQTINYATQKANGTISQADREAREIDVKTRQIKKVMKVIWNDIKKEIPEIVNQLVAEIIKALGTALRQGISTQLDRAGTTLKSGVKNLMKIGGQVSGITPIAKFGYGLYKSYAKNATGNRNFGGGLSMVGERGAELVDLPKGSRIYNNQETNRIMNNNNKKDITINLYGNNNTNLVNQLTRELRMQGVS